MSHVLSMRPYFEKADIDPDFERAPSPIIYPGGKSRAIHILVPLITEGMRMANTNEVVSPFTGGANLEVTLANQGARVYGSDILKPLVNFWDHALTNPAALAEAVEDYKIRSVNGDEFKQLQAILPNMLPGLDAAAAFFVVNRLSVYGMTLSGNFSPNVELTDGNLAKLRHFSAPSLTVDARDYREMLRMHASAFAYLDPPYDFADRNRHGYYGVQGNTSRGFDHDALFEIVADRPNWMMSHNAEPHILKRYEGFPTAFPKWQYGMGKTSESHEVLIFSKNCAALAEMARERITEAAADFGEAPSAANDSGTVMSLPTGGSNRWAAPDLTVCTESMIPAPAFPKHILGEALTAFCEAAAAGANAHFDYVVATLLAVVAGLIGNSLTVKTGPAFVQPSVIWMCVVGKSGAGKTPAMDLFSDIVDALEDCRGMRHRLRDVTVAASVKLAAENGKGLLLFRDELSGWWASMKRTGGEDFWLEAFNGKRFTKDRKNDEPLLVERLSVSVIGGAQPSMVKDITTDGKNRGFSSRWLFAYPEPVPGYATSDVEIDIHWASTALGRLIDLPVADACLSLAPEAQRLFEEWWDATRRDNAEAEGLWAEWMHKQGGNVLRLALVLEMLKWAATAAEPLPPIVSTSTLSDALTLMDSWVIPMAERTLEVMYRSTGDQRASTLAKHLRRHKLTSFNARKLRRGEYGAAGVLRDKAVMDEACQALLDARVIRFVGARNHSKKGRLSGDYEVHPALLQEQAP